jgi:hypothetical protein
MDVRTVFERLRDTTHQIGQAEELPARLVVEVMEIADNPGRYAAKTELVERLTAQISNFDPYAGVGCFDTSTSAETIQTTIRQILGCQQRAQDERQKVACEIVQCCQFFKDHMKDLPKSAEYIQNRLCYGDYEACNRFKIYKEFGGSSVPYDLDPDDTEAVHKVILCLRSKM